MLPVRLLNLAVEAFGKYISDILVKLATLSDTTKVEDLETEYLHPICYKLEQIIHEFIPASIADFVTENLITQLLIVYNQVQKKREKKIHSHEQNCCIEVVIIGLCSAILHPSINKFKFSRAQLPSLSKFREKIFIDSFLNALLRKLSNIKYLKLEIYKFDEEMILENLKLMTELEQLTFFGCTNVILEEVSKNCQRLRFLDVRNSSKITDSSVQSILKMTCLEHLNIRNTSIFSKGIDYFANALGEERYVNKKLLFQSFKFGIEYHHVAVIPQCFPNLKSLDICVDKEFNLFPLRHLEHLSQLAISFIHVENISSVHTEKLLIDIGSQLIVLKLNDFCQNEFINVFKIVGRNCRSLKYLSLNSLCYYWPYVEHSNAETNHLPEMKSLETFEVRVFSKIALEAILPKLVNVREIKLLDYNADLGLMLKKLLFENRIGHLEKIYVDGCLLQSCGKNIVISKLNGSYAYVHLKDFIYTINKISEECSIDFIDKSFMNVPISMFLR
ncbi:hypothetical protein L9F63_001781 [Diploptera punctata]|uniref:Uncharacterized protein n=1 Tax=Diploptera punctata TaxID=6984 RepID=A0AAD8A381_DIPPU|nr:hypothetical protein L9F63_001781 [Diploptera punctata]